jgi:uncharacterized protein YjbJ (UPF0337 family)
MKNLTETDGVLKTINGKLKQKYAMLADDDQLIIDSKKEVLIDRLQVSLGKTKDEVCRIIYD